MTESIRRGDKTDILRFTDFVALAAMGANFAYRRRPMLTRSFV
jgi:hypothetical protein